MAQLDDVLGRLAAAELPAWLSNFIALTRPATTSAVIAIPAIGSFTVGIVAGFDPARGLDMANASVAFLKGIPDAAYGMITAISLGYAAAKTTEAVKAPPPAAGSPPEQPAQLAPAAPAGRTVPENPPWP
jgi:hypothetical protein